MCSSRSCCSSTGLGACVSRSLRALRLRERDHVADRLGAGHQHDDAVEAERDAAVRRRAVLERVEQEAELRAAPPPRRCRARGTPAPARRRGGSAPSRRRSPSRSARCRTPSRARSPGSVSSNSLVAVLGRGERVVHRGPALLLLVVLEHREVDHPQRPPAGSDASPRSWPIFARSAPSASFTTFALSAPKNIRSPSLAPVRSRIAPQRVRRQELHDRRLQSLLAGFEASFTLM